MKITCGKVFSFAVFFFSASCVDTARLVNFKKFFKVAPFVITASLSTFEAIADFPALNTYKNELYHTQISYPSTWEQKFGTLSNERSLVAFVDPKDVDTSLSLAFTPIPADYSYLSSFGGKETLRQYLLPKGEDVHTDVLNEVLSGEKYFLEYVVDLPGAPSRHIQSVFALRPQETVVGVTLQTKQDTFPLHQEEFKSIIPTLDISVD